MELIYSKAYYWLLKKSVANLGPIFITVEQIDGNRRSRGLF